MPLGNAMPGQKFKVLVATVAAPTVFIPVGLMNNYRISSQGNEAEFDTFDSVNPIVFQGKKRRTMTVAGYLGDADSGQTALFAAEAAAETPVIKVLWDGVTNGFTQQVIITSYQSEASAGNPGSPISLSFDFKPTTAAGTIIGTGPLL
jgi:hypothetical protein